MKNPPPDESPIPYMHRVLFWFGIDPSPCKEVPLEKYFFDEFSDTVLNITSPPLAQRLRTRFRKINCKDSH